MAPVPWEDQKGTSPSTPVIGAAVNSEKLLGDPQYSELVMNHFTSISPEYQFKADYLSPSQHYYNWIAGDQLTEFCAVNNKRCHGHTLVWHKAVPLWLNNVSDKKIVEDFFEGHIRMVTGRYASTVNSWDVVNEAFSSEGKLEPSFWSMINEHYILRAFQIAHECAPKALLFYNDFDLESNPVKARGVLDYLVSLRASGAVINGIGFQTHISTGFTQWDIFASNLRMFFENGFKIHLSEVDISTASNSDDEFYKQATTLQMILSLYSAVPDEMKYGITFWGVRDHESWLSEKEKNHPLLFDELSNPKPMFRELKRSLLQDQPDQC
jgi:endo-1,4-beta-xylanase